MKSPNDFVRGRIVDYDENHHELIIRARYSDYFTLCKRGYVECTVQLLDSRKMSDKQRRACYSLLRAISEYTGEGLPKTKEAMKRKFINEELCDPGMETFSLANTSKSMACAFQKYLVNFIIDFEIPLQFPILDYVDDIPAYVYNCAARKKCCVCGQYAEPHHYDRIGSHKNRNEIDQLGMRMEPLCRGHHMECHDIGQEEFDAQYKVVPIRIDAALKKVWGFTGTRKRFEWIDSAEWYPETNENAEE